MDARDRVLLPLHTNTPSEEFGGLAIDVAPLFLHLLLFENVILRSMRLADVAKLVRLIGGEETIHLLDAAGVRIRAGIEHTGATTRGTVLHLIHMHPPDPEAELSRMMDEAFSPLGLRRPVNRSLKRLVARRRLTTDPAHNGFAPAAAKKAFAEAVSNSDVFSMSLEMAVKKYGKGLSIPAGSMRCEQVDGNLRFDARFVSGDPSVIDNVMRHACLSVAKLHEELGAMARDKAIIALDIDSSALLEVHAKHLLRAENPNELVDQFARVLQVADLPDFGTEIQERGINVDAFLRVRETAECREFRTFLTRADAFDADELRERTNSWRARIVNKLHGTPGRVLRFVATTGVGFLAGGIQGAFGGIAFDAADTFLLDHLFPRSGIVTFVGEQYPSIFENS